MNVISVKFIYWSTLPVFLAFDDIIKSPPKLFEGLDILFALIEKRKVINVELEIDLLPVDRLLSLSEHFQLFLNLVNLHVVVFAALRYKFFFEALNLRLNIVEFNNVIFALLQETVLNFFALELEVCSTFFDAERDALDYLEGVSYLLVDLVIHLVRRVLVH